MRSPESQHVLVFLALLLMCLLDTPATRALAVANAQAVPGTLLL